MGSACDDSFTEVLRKSFVKFTFYIPRDLRKYFIMRRRRYPWTGREVLDNIHFFALRRVPGAAGHSPSVRRRGTETIRGVSRARELASFVDPRENGSHARAIVPADLDRDEETRGG